jgi:hypothetical protein
MLPLGRLRLALPLLLPGTPDIVALAAAGFQDFVIAHEHLHLRVLDHGRVFKALIRHTCRLGEGTKT